MQEVGVGRVVLQVVPQHAAARERHVGVRVANILFDQLRFTKNTTYNEYKAAVLVIG